MTPSVYVIDETLSSLMLMREEDGVTDAERAAIDGQIEAWMAAEVEKVDRVRAYLLHCKVMREAAAAEKDRQAVREKQWAAREDRLKSIVQYVMEAQQRRRCEGPTGVLRLQASGGMRALTITDATLVPEEYCVYRGIISAKAWESMRRLIGEVHWEAWSGRQDVQMERCPLNDAVRKALEKKCAVCGGVGKFSEIGEYEPDPNGAIPCEACNGTGGGTVPGAHMAERSTHLRVE